MIKIFTGRLILVRLAMLAAMGSLVLIGILGIYSCGNPQSGTGVISAFLWRKQTVFAVVGLVALIIVNLISYRRLGAVSYWVYSAILALLGLLLIDKYMDIPFIPMINSTRRWIRLGLGQRYLLIQPSEFCKLAYILALAWYLRYRSNYRKFASLLGPFVLTVLPMVLIVLEPDLGTVLLMMPILFSMLFAAGAKVKHLAIVVLLAIVVSPVMWHFMENYQRMRISGVLLQNQWVFDKVKDNPKLAQIFVGNQSNLTNWKRDRGYHLMHSKLAIGSGGLKGYGFAKGPYIQGPYSKYPLPASHNDFIFSIIGHQWGFGGCLAVLTLYLIIIACGIEIAILNTEPFGRLIAVGIVAMIVVEVVVNVAMTVGLMPITGLTLPFVSYGGSSLLVSMISIGLLNNIGRERPFSVAGKGFENQQ